MATIKKSYGQDAGGNDMSTQVAVIRDYCISTGKKVSQAMVTERWGFTRLSAIIFILKDQLEREGGIYTVCDERVSGLNRFGNKVNFKEYWIEKVKS
jgi:hypothetical protein